jgi:Dimethlysulfonioproprionate lyase
LAPPRTRELVEAIEALADELDWRQTYAPADFGERFLGNYGYNEWVGQRGAFMSDWVACGVLLFGPDTESRPFARGGGTVSSARRSRPDPRHRNRARNFHSPRMRKRSRKL